MALAFKKDPHFSRLAADKLQDNPQPKDSAGLFDSSAKPCPLLFAGKRKGHTRSGLDSIALCSLFGAMQMGRDASKQKGESALKSHLMGGTSW